MISIEKQLLQRSVIAATLLVTLLGLLHYWWAERFFMQIQKQQLEQESTALKYHLQEVSPTDINNQQLKLPKHSGHLYYIQQEGFNWSSSPELTDSLPISTWLATSGYHEFKSPQDRRYLILSAQEKAKQSYLVILDITASHSELDRSHVYIITFTIAALLLLILLQRRLIRKTFTQLDPVSQQIEAIHKGAKPNLPSTDIIEIEPLVTAINRLLGYLDSRAQRSRNAVGDLSHALKTPLAIIQQVVERNDSGLGQKDKNQLLSQASHINQIIHAELKRARIAGRGTQSHVFSIKKALANLSSTLALIYPQKNINFQVNIAPDCYFPGDQSDFNELMGNLLDNASKWCLENVQVDIISESNRLLITVQDDGPGCDPKQLDSLLGRGNRLDERKKGHGLGLSIVAAIVQQYEGNIDIHSPADGGFIVQMHFPLS